MDEVTFWAPNGQKLATYALTEVNGQVLLNQYPSFTVSQSGYYYYFGGRMIKNESNSQNWQGWVFPDRLGSIGKFYPYGTERPSATGNGTEKFTGYFRDAETGSDYAINRYGLPGQGRFMTPDRVTGNAADPGSWNKYAYTRGDPINRVDPSGSDDCDPNYCVTVTAQSDPVDCDPIFNGINGFSCAGEGPQNQSTGAGKGSVAVTTRNVTNTGPNEDAITAAVLSLETFIDPSCQNWLQSGGVNLDAYIGDLLGNGLIGHGTITTTQANSVVNAITSPSDAPGVAIVINDSGAFFNGAVTTDRGKLQGNTAAAQIFILIHELAHSMGVPGFLDDSGSQQAVNNNDIQIEQQCSKTSASSSEVPYEARSSRPFRHVAWPGVVLRRAAGSPRRPVHRISPDSAVPAIGEAGKAKGNRAGGCAGRRWQGL
jgi:RHS repeat-associated protein